jgi:hypothetical protein
MLDPVTVIATASAAYNALKKGIEIGRELQDMGGQLATWAGAISDIEFLAKKAENPAVVEGGWQCSGRGYRTLSLLKKKDTKRSAMNCVHISCNIPYGHERVGGVAPH